MTPPIKGYINKKFPRGSVTQWFGENPSLYQRNVCINNAPCHPSMTCPSGQGCLIGHNGIDVVAPWGTPLYAIEGGTVVEVNDSPTGYGKHIRWISEPDKNGICREWTYGHNSENLVKVGQKIKEGHHVANMGNTGFVVSGSTPYWEHNPYAGTHVHIGMRQVVISPNGWQYAPNTPRIVVMDYYNGYFGSVDFDYILQEVAQMEETARLIEILKQAIQVFLNKPSYNGSIISLQKCLLYEGLFPVTVRFTENFGPITQKAVREFQVKHNLHPTGVSNVGPLTQRKLKQLYP